MIKEKKQTLDVYRNAFEERKKISEGSESAWMRQARQNAFERFQSLGFPDRKNEAWKYTSVSRIANGDFENAPETHLNKVSISQIEPLLYKGLKASRFVFVDGVYSKELSSLLEEHSSIQILRMKDAIVNSNPEVKKYFESEAGNEKDGFEALSRALFEDGFFILIPKNISSEMPLHIVHISSADREVMTHSRNLVVLEENSRAVILESYISLSRESQFHNCVTEIVLKQGAVLDHIKTLREVRNFHIAKTKVFQGKDSRFHNWFVALSGQIARNEMHVLLSEEGGAAELEGFYLLSGDDHLDNHLLVDHLKPRGTSHQLYKGILDDRSRAVFNGKAFVHKDAQKTQADQVNKNLILSERAAVDTKPELEIYADDVKCSHGAAVGQLDPDTLFYLKSRGIAEDKARKILAYGFAEEVIQGIPIKIVREDLLGIFLDKIKGES